MAKYSVTFSCGHTETMYLYGKEKARYSRIEYLEKHGLCSACYKAKQEARRAATLAAAAAPPLTGTERQITRANNIRARFIRDTRTIDAPQVISNLATLLDDRSFEFAALKNPRKIAAALTAANCPEDYFTDAAAAIKSVIDYTVKNRPAAKWWIEARHREQPQTDLLTSWASALADAAAEPQNN